MATFRWQVFLANLNPVIAARPTFMWLVFLILTPGCSNNTDLNNREKSRSGFDSEKKINDWVAMWNSYDLSRVEKLFLTDSTVTYFSSEKEGLIKGIEAVIEHHKGFGFVEGGKAQPNKLWLEDVHTTVRSNVAVVSGIWYFLNQSEGEDQTSKGPFTAIYVQDENEYRIAHMHFANY